MADAPLIEIDGSHGEGGGQILRTALALSLITGMPFRLRNVRHNRKPKPGLRPQHLAGVKAAAAVGQGELRGASVGSTDLTFRPGPVTPGKYHFPIGTAGATSLVLHTVYLPLMWKADGPSEIVIEGGTHNEKAPSFHFLQTTWRAWLELLGLKVRLEMRRPGFYPRGGGLVIAHLQPAGEIKGLKADWAPSRKVEILSATAGLPEHVAARQLRQAEERVREETREIESKTEEWPGGPGSFVGVTVKGRVPALFGGLGARGKPAERVADEAAEEALAFLRAGASVDEHSADQMLLPLALAAGPSEFRVAAVSRHLTTNAWTVGQFLDRPIRIDGAEGSTGVVRVG